MAAVAQDIEPKGIFPFFHLPRELRDEIYNNLFVHRTVIEPAKHWSRSRPTTWALIRPDTKMFLVCCQFNEEYEARIKDNTALYLEASYVHGLREALHRIRRPLLAVTKLEVAFDLYPCGFADEFLDAHRKSRDGSHNISVAHVLRRDSYKVLYAIEESAWNPSLVSSLNFNVHFGHKAKTCLKLLVEHHEELALSESRVTQFNFFSGASYNWRGLPMEAPQLLARWTHREGMELLPAGVDLCSKATVAESEESDGLRTTVLA